MKKATKKTINYLRKFVGHKVIRSQETIRGDFSYTRTPLILRGFSDKGEVIISYTEDSFERSLFGYVERTLPLEFTDSNWLLYSRLRKVPNSKLNKWRGKRIRRTAPMGLTGDCSYMETPVKLISASQYHLIVELADNMQIVLDYRWVNPNEWMLVE